MLLHSALNDSKNNCFCNITIEIKIIIIIIQLNTLTWLPEMSTDQDWIGLDQDWSQFWPDQDWIGLQFFENWRIRTGSDWENIWCFCVIIMNISKLLVVIRFHRIANWSCIYKTSNRLVVYILPSISKALLGILWNSNCIHRYPHITLILVAT